MGVDLELLFLAGLLAVAFSRAFGSGAVCGVIALVALFLALA